MGLCCLTGPLRARPPGLMLTEAAAFLSHLLVVGTLSRPIACARECPVSVAHRPRITSHPAVMPAFLDAQVNFPQSILHKQHHHNHHHYHRHHYHHQYCAVMKNAKASQLWSTEAIEQSRQHHLTPDTRDIAGKRNRALHHGRFTQHYGIFCRSSNE